MKRDAQNDLSSVLPSVITQPSVLDQATRTDLTYAASRTAALTVVVSTFEDTITRTDTTLISTRLRTVMITDSAQFSSIRASESSAKAGSQTSQTNSAKTSAATAKSDSGSNNLSTLIPAIVVPVAVVLISTFVAFWLIMRQRHKKQLKQEPEFVMASKPEKPVSRGNSNSSGHSSTRELVPMSKLEKEMVITTSKDVARSSLDMFPPKYATSDIGVARPMTPPDKKKSMDKKQFTNFSSVRPGTASRNGDGNRSRSQSQTARDMPDSRAASRNGSKRPNRGSSPSIRGHNQNPGSQGRDSPAHIQNSQRTTTGQQTTSIAGNRAPPPQSLGGNTPTGAFNGASPISQYSPIIKGIPDIGTTTTTRPGEAYAQPSPLSTTHLPLARSVDSPTNDNVLSRENMRIARMANSSRLGMNDSPEPGSRSLSNNGNKHEAPATSPRLPPPLSRGDLLPKPFARGPDSPSGGSSIYPSPSIGTGQTPRLPQLGTGPSSASLPGSAHTVGMASSTALGHRVSVVSRLSSDDGYVDMELDAKSDVSSLDERDRWEMESDRNAVSRSGAGYAGSGYGSTPMSPIQGTAPTASSAGTGSSAPNLRDRDSEGPFVLSRY